MTVGLMVLVENGQILRPLPVDDFGFFLDNLPSR